MHHSNGGVLKSAAGQSMNPGARSQNGITCRANNDKDFQRSLMNEPSGIAGLLCSVWRVKSRTAAPISQPRVLVRQSFFKHFENVILFTGTIKSPFLTIRIVKIIKPEPIFLNKWLQPLIIIFADVPQPGREIMLTQWILIYWDTFPPRVEKGYPDVKTL